MHQFRIDAFLFYLFISLSQTWRRALYSQLHANANAGYSLHQLQGDKQHGVTRSGHLLKKSEGKMRRVWQKRRCAVQAEGYLDICHADENKPPTRVNLLTCQIKLVPDDKRGFDLVSCKYPRSMAERSFRATTTPFLHNERTPRNTHCLGFRQ